MTPYELSVQNHLRKHLKHQLGQPQMPAWLPTLLARIPTAIPAQHPFEVLCVTGLMCQQVDYDYSMDVGVRLLLQRGWSVEMSMHMFKNFRFMHPQDQIQPDMLRLLSRKQLVEQYGSTYGAVIADVCSDPDSQPVFAALLSGDLDRLVARPAAHAAFKIKVDSNIISYDTPDLPNGFFPLGALIEAAAPAAMAQNNTSLSSLPMAEAAQLYKDATGCDPEFVFNINPRELDYDALARSSETLRTLEDFE